jgi:hypothetical protein
MATIWASSVTDTRFHDPGGRSTSTNTRLQCPHRPVFGRCSLVSVSLDVWTTAPRKLSGHRRGRPRREPGCWCLTIKTDFGSCLPAAGAVEAPAGRAWGERLGEGLGNPRSAERTCRGSGCRPKGTTMNQANKICACCGFPTLPPGSIFDICPYVTGTTTSSRTTTRTWRAGPTSSV